MTCTRFETRVKSEWRETWLQSPHSFQSTRRLVPTPAARWTRGSSLRAEWGVRVTGARHAGTVRLRKMTRRRPDENILPHPHESLWNCPPGIPYHSLRGRGVRVLAPRGLSHAHTLTRYEMSGLFSQLESLERGVLLSAVT